VGKQALGREAGTRKARGMGRRLKRRGGMTDRWARKLENLQGCLKTARKEMNRA
jgi:hypothetical protein